MLFTAHFVILSLVYNVHLIGLIRQHGYYTIISDNPQGGKYCSDLNRLLRILHTNGLIVLYTPTLFNYGKCKSA